jgi:hypothetical protein
MKEAHSKEALKMKDAHYHVMLRLADEMKAEKDAVDKKNVELSTSLATAIQQRDEILLEVEVAKQQHKEEIASFVELAGVGTIEEVKNILRGHREIMEQEKVLLEHHEKVQLIQGQLRKGERGLLSCYEDVEAKKRRLFSMTSEHEAATKRAKKCRPGPKVR